MITGVWKYRGKSTEIEFAPRETMKGLEGYHVKIKLL
ncbi:TPA_asm: addiction module toxin, GnsA/GnsB family [Salmonella enterica subsp. enterica serovar Java]|uniref:Addiction module toxin, GnsA/GnsB family n=1 Tax=Salmonella enterica subsp. enterica serovar Java TaxID=224729 RepID=A0A732AH68_SALEB|nr:addiction module toxin, GnsA/GnsB family [Salmonella enterica subsp. enterica serovar Java]